jgi:hypothetical protein
MSRAGDAHIHLLRELDYSSSPDIIERMSRAGDAHIHPLRELDYASSPDIIARMSRAGDALASSSRLDYASSPDIIARMSRAGDALASSSGLASSPAARMSKYIHPCIFFECDTFEKAKEKGIELGFTLEEFNSMIEDAGYDINWEASKVQYYEDLEAGKYEYQDQDDCQDLTIDECQDLTIDECQDLTIDKCQDKCQDLVIDKCQDECLNQDLVKEQDQILIYFMI